QAGHDAGLGDPVGQDGQLAVARRLGPPRRPVQTDQARGLVEGFAKYPLGLILVDVRPGAVTLHVDRQQSMAPGLRKLGHSGQAPFHSATDLGAVVPGSGPAHPIEIWGVAGPPRSVGGIWFRVSRPTVVDTPARHVRSVNTGRHFAGPTGRPSDPFDN